SQSGSPTRRFSSEPHRPSRWNPSRPCRLADHGRCRPSAAAPAMNCNTWRTGPVLDGSKPSSRLTEWRAQFAAVNDTKGPGSKPEGLELRPGVVKPCDSWKPNLFSEV